ncbi:MAG TPA: hypothetical protein VFI49_12615, partial [Rudaea sp.]|nr:hypothetical protein [Rudaea sp.]
VGTSGPANTVGATDYAVIPAGYESLPGNNVNNSPFGAGARRFQMAFGASALGAIPVGTAITAIAFRLAGPAPDTDQTIAEFDVSLSTSAKPAGSLSTTFATNRGADAVLVRSGPLAITVADYPSGAFGRPITFSKPFVYGGGDLLIEIAATAPTAPFVVDNMYPTPINAESAYASSFSATTANAGTFVDTIVTQLWTDDIFHGSFEP